MKQNTFFPAIIRPPFSFDNSSVAVPHRCSWCLMFNFLQKEQHTPQLKLSVSVPDVKYYFVNISERERENKSLFCNDLRRVKLLKYFLKKFQINPIFQSDFSIFTFGAMTNLAGSVELHWKIIFGVVEADILNHFAKKLEVVK
jgi:hypothetical protein